MALVLQILLIIFGPAVFIYLLKGKKIGKVLSPVVMCYVIGISVATFGLFEVNEELSMTISKVTVLLAIPLLLFSADIVAWFKHAKSTVLSFVFAIVAALISCLVFSLIFAGKIDGVWNYAAMLTGVYTGGTANLQAVGIAIEAPPDFVTGINTVEMLVGGIYLLFLTSVAPLVFGKILPKYKESEGEMMAEESPFSWSSWKQMLVAFLLSIVVAGLSVGIVSLIVELTPKDDSLADFSAILILILTTISVLFSFRKNIRALSGSFEAGDYLIMMFCVAVGMMSDLGEIWDKSLYLLLFTAATWLATVLIHLLLSWMAKIDRDTTIITSTAALYGPPFVGQIAAVLGNRKIVFAGIATGLFGYAIGNYLGVGVFYLLQNWLT